MVLVKRGRPIRRSLVWCYCALISLSIYMFAFYNLMVIINSNDSRKSSRHENPQGFHREIRLSSKTQFKGGDHEQYRQGVTEDSLSAHSDQGVTEDSLSAHSDQGVTEDSLSAHSDQGVTLDSFSLLKLNRSRSTRANGELETTYQTPRTEEGFLFPAIWKCILRFFQTSQAVPKSASTNVVNPHTFDYVINASRLCQDMDDIALLVYVHTAPGNFKRRMVIRQTWGDVSQYDVTVRVIFVMGVSNKDLENQEVRFESESYGDIVQEDFTDSYRNLTYKAIAALKWISNCATRSKFVLKSDDDIFVNVFVLLRHLRLQMGRCSPQRCQGMLFCLVWENMVVMRNGKWKVEETEWQASTYPKYCSGSAFFMTTDVAISLFRASLEVPFFWVDDVYITGLLPVRAGSISHTNYASYYLLDGKQLAEKFTGFQWYNYIFSHVHDLNSILAVWRKVAAISRGEIQPTIQFGSL